VVDLALGGSHSCAVLEDGSVRCWGDNLFGQLGDGTRKGRPAPAPVPQLPSSSHVALGDQHTCAITRQGEAWCWGGNAYGQLGDGSQMERTQARKVAELAGVSQLALGYSHSCALLREGRVRCWGVNLDGQLGDGSRVSRLTPVPLPLERVAEVAAGSNHSCARLTSGGIACWGSQGHGRLGDGVISGLGRRLEPFVLPLRDVVRISANGDHTCAITGNGLLSCWGKNVQGMLGIGSEEAASTPTPVR
jgi:alpha-tubulin suppressor-like RCC1 family protein